MLSSSDPEYIALGLQQFAEQAKRMDITWSLHQATTAGDANTTQSIFSTQVVLDGDTKSISASSLIGVLPGAARVFVMFVPPSGAYIIGRFDVNADSPPWIFNNLTVNGFLTLNGLIQVNDPTMRRIPTTQGTNQAVVSTTFTAGSPVCGVSFTAPPSGQGVMVWHAGFAINTANTMYVSAEIKNGLTLDAGSVVVGASTDFALVAGTGLAGGHEDGGGIFRDVSGLTPGNPYNLVVMHRVSGGNGTIFQRSIAWEPSW